MARYIETIRQPGETVLYSTSLHWIVYGPAIALWFGAVALLLASQFLFNGTAIALALASATLIAIAALIFMLRGWFQRFSTETDVTDRRVIHKQGFIKRRTFEMSLDKVESVDVDQTVFGRLLNYGDVTVRGVGEGVERIKLVARPLDFRTSITARSARA